jgi:hypothetical protein
MILVRGRKGNSQTAQTETFEEDDFLETHRLKEDFGVGEAKCSPR